MGNENALVIMAKQPRPGYTKTRLCPPFSYQQAAELYEALLLDSMTLGNSLPDVQLAVAITPVFAHDYFEEISPPGSIQLPVQGKDIGACLYQATEQLRSKGFKKVIALNADGPSLPREYLLQAFSLLENSDVVLGPGEDGGYYLIGTKKNYPDLFEDISWSTSNVLTETLAKAHKLNLRAALTPPWYDVDTPQDAARLESELSNLPPERLANTRRLFESYSFKV